MPTDDTVEDAEALLTPTRAQNDALEAADENGIGVKSNDEPVEELVEEAQSTEDISFLLSLLLCWGPCLSWFGLLLNFLLCNLLFTLEFWSRQFHWRSSFKIGVVGCDGSLAFWL